MHRSILAGVALLAFGTLTSQTAAAQNAADIYSGRTVTLLVGYGAGGSYGQTAQLLSRHLDRLLPGKPNVIVQYMPGAGGLKATNYAYNVMPKGGRNLLMPAEGSLTLQLLRPDKVKYVMNRFTWLGTVFGSNQVLIVRSDTGVRSIADATKKQVVIASTGTGSGTFLVPKMMNSILGTKFKIVTGYKGSAAAVVTIESGESSGMSLSWVSWKGNQSHWFDKGEKNFATILAQVGYEKDPDLPNVPLLTELADGEDEKAAAAMLSTAAVIGRGLALPPGAPSSLVEPLRTAFGNTVSDAAFNADADKRKIPVRPQTGAEIQKIIDDATSMSPRAVKKAREYIFGK